MGKTFEEHLCNLEDLRLETESKEVLVLPNRSFNFLEVEWIATHCQCLKQTYRQYWTGHTCSKDVERFMGLANYHCNFVNKLTEVSISH